MHPVLIVGAGPTGLTCAIELARRKWPVMIIEQKSARETISKAIGINPRSLTLLEAADVTPRLLAQGLKIQTIQIHYAPQKCMTFHLNKLSHRYNFMLSLPQDETEAILEQRLQELGVTVQRHTQLVALKLGGKHPVAVIEAGGQTQEVVADFIVGADGAHSIVRKQINVDFEGETLPEHWSLADVRMHWPLGNTDGHGFLQGPGKIGVILPLGGDRYRIITNHPGAFDILPQPYTIDEIGWQSDFSISCRLASCFQKDRVFLAGDAAHIHSPVGGRGMNLGIEDACILAQLLTEGHWSQYNALRRPAGRQVVKWTSYAYQLLSTKNPYVIWGRNHLLFPLLQLSWVQKQQLTLVAGLSHK